MQALILAVVPPESFEKTFDKSLGPKLLTSAPAGFVVYQPLVDPQAPLSDCEHAQFTVR